ncbi:MAG: alpha/beta fold hydrolase [Actinobacteria bacterium]|nr:alpha/beta fold hydrolase [Actinomycetota bacterium]
MKYPLPPRPELGTHQGLAYALFKPQVEPRAAVVILHGAGSAKESHFDFARTALAYDFAAIAFDARGHGRSEGAFGPQAIEDVLAICAFARRHAPHLALRGSSLGGMLAIHGAAAEGDADAVVAICPAPEDFLLRGLRSGRIDGFAADRHALEPWLETLDLRVSAASLGPRCALLLLHARGDEQVPYTVSEELIDCAREPKRLLLMPGGHHRSIQHDLELQGESLSFIERAVAGRVRG